TAFSASTRTPTSIEVRQAAFTVAMQRSSSPTKSGSAKVIRSIPAVTTLPPQCRIAAMPAASSHIRITTPPWMKPAEFASGMPIHRISSEQEAEAGRGASGSVSGTDAILFGCSPRAARDPVGDLAVNEPRAPELAVRLIEPLAHLPGALLRGEQRDRLLGELVRAAARLDRQIPRDRPDRLWGADHRQSMTGGVKDLDPDAAADRHRREQHRRAGEELVEVLDVAGHPYGRIVDGPLPRRRPPGDHQLGAGNRFCDRGPELEQPLHRVLVRRPAIPAAEEQSARVLRRGGSLGRREQQVEP